MSAHPVVATTPVAVSDDATDRVARLFDTHQHALYRLARRLTNSPEDARDLVQDTFLRAARNPDRVPAGHSQEEAWLVRVAVNLQRDQWRKAQVRNRTASLLQAAASTTTAASQESAVVARAEIWNALNALPPRRRAVIVLHELEGASIPTIASLLGISAITVRWHLSRGRRDLQYILGAQTGETP